MYFNAYLYCDEIVNENPPRAVVLTTYSFEDVDRSLEPSNGNEACFPSLVAVHPPS